MPLTMMLSIKRALSVVGIFSRSDDTEGTVEETAVRLVSMKGARFQGLGELWRALIAQLMMQCYVRRANRAVGGLCVLQDALHPNQ